MAVTVVSSKSLTSQFKKESYHYYSFYSKEIKTQKELSDLPSLHTVSIGGNLYKDLTATHPLRPLGAALRYALCSRKHYEGM